MSGRAIAKEFTHDPSSIESSDPRNASLNSAKNLSTKKVIEMLSSIERGKSPRGSAGELRDLARLGMISLMAVSEYNERTQEIATVDARRELLARRTTRFHTLRDEQRTRSIPDSKARKSFERRIDEMSRSIEAEKAVIRSLEALAVQLQSYVRTSAGYICLTEEGKQIITEMNDWEVLRGQQSFISHLRAYRSQDADMKAAVTDFYMMLSHMTDANGFSKKDSQVCDAALGLSLISGECREVFDTFRVFNRYLYYHGLQTYDRLGVAVEATRYVYESGQDAQAVRSELIDIYMGLCEYGAPHSSIDTWCSASRLLFSRGDSARAKVEHFVACFEAVYATEEKRTKALASVYMRQFPEFLTRYPGKPQKVNTKLSELHSALVDAEFADDSNTWIAALELMAHTGSISSAVRDFKKAFSTLQDFGAGRQSDWNPLAARIACLPGSIRTNVRLLDLGFDMLTSAKFQSGMVAANRSLRLLKSIYKSAEA